MTTQTLLASAAFALVTSAVFAFVGVRLARRPLSPSDKPVVYAFSSFWLGLAISTFIGPNGLLALAAALGETNLTVALAMSQVSLVAISVALWGLLYYLVYLFTGRRQAWIPLAVFYAAFFAFLEYFVVDGRPNGLRVENWAVNVSYEKYPAASTQLSPLIWALLLGLLVPQILGSLAYLSLSFRVQNRTQRFRIVVVSLSILVWFASPFLAIGANISQSVIWQLFSRFIGLAAAVAIFIAYHPPGWMKRRYHIMGLSDETNVEGEMTAETMDSFPRMPSGRGIHIPA